METGWWKLNTEMFDDSEVTDTDREHIAEMVKQGCTSGELIHGEVE